MATIISRDDARRRDIALPRLLHTISLLSAFSAASTGYYFSHIRRWLAKEAGFSLSPAEVARRPGAKTGHYLNATAGASRWPSFSSVVA